MAYATTVRRVFRELTPTVRHQAPSLNPREVETVLLEREAFQRIDKLFDNCIGIRDKQHRMQVVQRIAERLLNVVEQCEQDFSLSSE